MRKIVLKGGLGLMVTLGWLGWLGVAPAHAMPSTLTPAEQRELIDELTVDRALAVAQERQLASEEQERLYAKLRAKTAELKAAEEQAVGDRKRLVEIQEERERLSEERAKLVVEIEQRDRVIEAEVRAYREAITKIASSPDPRKQAALRRYADGQEREAIAELEELEDALDAAQDKAVKISRAARRRPVAALALSSYDRGNQTLEEVIARYEELTTLDPGVTWDWVVLAGLYEKQGNLARARRAAEQAHARLEHKGVLREQLAALLKLGDVLRAAGELGEAKRRYRAGLAVARKLAKANPTSVEAWRDVSVSLNKVGDVAVAAGELGEAKRRYRAGLAVARKLAKANQTSAEARRDVSIGLNKVGDVAAAAGELGAAKRRYRAGLAVARELAKANPTSAEALRDVSVSLNKVGDVAVAAGELGAAKRRYEEGLEVARKLAKANPTNAEAQRDVSASLDRVGDVAVAAGELGAAKRRYEEGLEVARRLATENPMSATAQRDVVISLLKLGKLTQSRDRLAEALRIARLLKERGQLAPSDHWIPGAITTLLAELPES